jgi:hypothetical protein
MTAQSELRTSFQYLRSVCRSFSERLVLGTAVRNGWSATALTDLAEGFRKGHHGVTMKPKEHAYRRTIEIAAERLYAAEQPYWLMKKSEKELTN